MVALRISRRTLTPGKPPRSYRSPSHTAGHKRLNNALREFAARCPDCDLQCFPMRGGIGDESAPDSCLICSRSTPRPTGAGFYLYFQPRPKTASGAGMVCELCNVRLSHGSGEQALPRSIAAGAGCTTPVPLEKSNCGLASSASAGSSGD